MSLISKWKLLKNLKECPKCGELIVPALGLWFHQDNDCSNQDGLMVYQDEGRVLVEVLNKDLQASFKKEFGEADIVKHK